MFLSQNLQNYQNIFLEVEKAANRPAFWRLPGWVPPWLVNGFVGFGSFVFFLLRSKSVAPLI